MHPGEDVVERRGQEFGVCICGDGGGLDCAGRREVELWVGGGGVTLK